MPDQLPTDNNTTAGTQAPTNAGNGQEFPSSRQILGQADPEANLSLLKAKYDGLRGAFAQRTSELQGQLEAKDLENASLKDQLAKLQNDQATLKTKADEADALRTQLTTAQNDLTAAKSNNDKQALLLKYPSLLQLRAEDGTNPMVDMLMAANLPPDQLDVRLAQLAKAQWQPVTQNGSTPPPPPPASGAEDVESLRQKALEIDRKRRSSDSPELREQSRQAWETFRKAQRAKQA
jgi:hypothetical protein